MNGILRINRKVFLIIVFILLLLGVGVALYLLSQQQDVRQRAAGGTDLIVTGFVLTDAAGNIRNKFWENEDIYARVSVRNQGDDTGVSTTGRTISQVYAHKTSPAAFGALSDVGVSLNNGEFAGNSVTKNYESRINGRNQGVYVSSPYVEDLTRKYAWRKADNSYTARVILNSDQAVTETDFGNNQATFAYTVVPFTAADEIGTQSFTKPADFDDYPCIEQNSAYIPDFVGCIQRVDNNVTKVQGRVTNNSGTTRRVYIASYKAYLPYVVNTCTQAECPEEYDFTWTQTFHRAEMYELPPGETIYLSTNVPSCAWQADIFIGDFPKSFHPNIPTYTPGVLGYLDGWYHFYPNYDQENTVFCSTTSISPTPSTVPSPTLTPTAGPSPTPTRTPTPTPTPTAGPSPTPTPTIPISSCPVPNKVVNVRIICPNCSSN